MLIDLPKDVSLGLGPYIPPADVVHKTYRPRVEGDRSLIEQAVTMIAEAKRPVFYCGGGVINSGPRASELLTQFVTMTGYPVTLTLMGLGAVPASHPQFLGMLGMHGTYEANLAMHGADLIVAIGSRFDDRVTGRLNAFAPHAKKIHVDIDRSSINKNVLVDLGIVGDVARVLEVMIEVWKERGYRADAAALADWRRQIEGWKARNCLAYRHSDEIIKPQFVIQKLWEVTGGDAIVTSDVGQHQMWAAQFYGFEKPNRWMTSGGLGTMGYGFPAAIGAKLVDPDRLALCFVGDGGFGMTGQELLTALQVGAAVIVLVCNNGMYGTIRMHQERRYPGRPVATALANPSFADIARAFGAEGFRVEDTAAFAEALQAARRCGRPAVIELIPDPAQISTRATLASPGRTL